MISLLRSWFYAPPQSVRFLLAGGSAATISWLIRFRLSLMLPFLPAVLCAAGFGMVVGFVAYRLFVFPNSDRPMTDQVRAFIVVNLSVLMVVALVSVVFRSILSRFVGLTLAEATAHWLGIAGGAILNYKGHAMLTFRRSDELPRTNQAKRMTDQVADQIYRLWF